jgi:hypothetical protein
VEIDRIPIVEAVMNTLTKPSKQDVREWLQRRQSSNTPPDRDRIRQELGWKLVSPPGKSRS